MEAFKDGSFLPLNLLFLLLRQRELFFDVFEILLFLSKILLDEISRSRPEMIRAEVNHPCHEEKSNQHTLPTSHERLTHSGTSLKRQSYRKNRETSHLSKSLRSSNGVKIGWELLPTMLGWTGVYKEKSLCIINKERRSPI